MRPRRTSDLCIAVNPHHAAFYRKAFHFQDIGGLKQYGKVNGAPAIALRLDLALARSLMSELRDGHRMISEVHEFLFHPAHVEAVMTRLVKDLRRVIPLQERVEYLLLPPRSIDKGFRAPTGHTFSQAATPRRVGGSAPTRRLDQTYLPGEMIAWGSSVFLISRTTCQNVVSFWDSQFIV